MRIILIFISILLISCSKQESPYEKKKKEDPYKFMKKPIMHLKKEIIFMLKRNLQKPN